MNELCFPTKFTSWIMQCVKTVFYSIVINREPNTPFKAAKRLRQGNPISLHLFAATMENLSRLLSTLKDNRQFSYHPRCAKLGVSHLCFADDQLYLLERDLQSITTLLSYFDIFAQASSLKANKDKISIYFGGISSEEQEDIVHRSGLALG